MFGGVRVHSLQMLSMVPGIGSMLGTGHSAAVLEKLQSQSGGQVIFGQEGDPVAERYQSMCRLINDQLSVANRALESVRQAVMFPNEFVAIQSIDDLYDVAPCMQEAIVMYRPVRDLLSDGRISGYGINPANLPEEDVYGRLINNGKTDSIDKKELEWYWRTDDPKLTEAELEAIEQTRGWIDKFLLEQMEVGGDWKDPTDPANTISKKKSK